MKCKQSPAPPTPRCPTLSLKQRPKKSPAPAERQTPQRLPHRRLLEIRREGLPRLSSAPGSGASAPTKPALHLQMHPYTKSPRSWEADGAPSRWHGALRRVKLRSVFKSRQVPHRAGPIACNSAQCFTEHPYQRTELGPRAARPILARGAICVAPAAGPWRSSSRSRGPSAWYC